MQPMICQIYRSPRRDEMYLYLPAEADPKQLPATLLQQFGTPEPSLRLLLTPDRKLARAESKVVLEAIEKQGFYLQMPPNPLVDET